jgi:hypothetical protein
MVLDDLLADRKSQARPVGLAVGGEGLEKAVQDLRRDAFAGVLQLRDHFLPVSMKRTLMTPPPGHGIGRVADQIVKNAGQTLRIDAHQDGRNGIDVFELDRFERDLLLDFLDQRFDERFVSHLGQDENWYGRLG